NPAVRDHLFQAIRMWVRDFGIDGLRLDVADCLELDFLRDLSAFCRALRPDFWLMGEVVHGDYRKWVNPETLDSVTNYECYKGLYSSHVDTNYFEIAYAFKRQFGDGGMYQNLPLYAFADNHDVNRVASSLTNPAHLYPLYGLLFTMPGVPSIYYGSEWGIEGRTNGSDAPLRPALNRGDVERNSPNRDLAQAIRRLAAVRHQIPALRHGDYQQLVVKHEQFAFARQIPGQRVIVAVNAANHPAVIDLPGRMADVLNGGERFSGTVTVPPCWLRVLMVE
ncbi:MAG TPA: alpha-amylase family glycosyl hydrolase, partial [Aggregatilineaceae bacterium]|nr:alpha-amylase family glycosyl hydrolase [Aggregatilineaceae bacterium]